MFISFFFVCLPNGKVHGMSRFASRQASCILRNHSGDLVLKESGLGRRVCRFCILLSAYKSAWKLNGLSNCLARDLPMGPGSYPDVCN